MSIIKAPPWEEMSSGRRAWEAVGGALLIGLLAGLALGVTTWLYVVLVVVAITGGMLAATQHRRPPHAAVRGLVGGLCFGVGVLLGFRLSGADDPAVAFPEPEILFLLPAMLPSVIFHLIGWRIGSKGRS
jgi:hypothetical protein